MGHIESLPTFPGGAFDSFVGLCAYALGKHRHKQMTKADTLQGQV
jgi:hypothetical protein